MDVRVNNVVLVFAADEPLKEKYIYFLKEIYKRQDSCLMFPLFGYSLVRKQSCSSTEKSRFYASALPFLIFQLLVSLYVHMMIPIILCIFSKFDQN